MAKSHAKSTGLAAARSEHAGLLGHPSVEPHPRLLSGFRTDVVRVDVALPGFSSRVLQFDLGAAYLPSRLSTHGSIPLSQAPALATAVPRALSVMLSHSSPYAVSIATRCTSTVSDVIHVLEWLWGQGYSRLAEVPHEAFRQFTVEIVAGGWPALLRWNARLSDLANELDDDKSWVTIATQGQDGRKSPRIDLNALNRRIGTRMTRSQVPSAFRARFALAFGRPAKSETDGVAEVEKSHVGVLTRVFVSTNLLHENYSSEGGLQFLPFPRPKALARKLGVPDERTPTLSVPELVQLVTQSHAWLFEYAPVLAKACLTDRSSSAVEHRAPRAFGHRGTNRQGVQELVTRYAQAANESTIPYKTISGFSAPARNEAKDAGNPTLLDLLRAVFAAGKILICATTGRRLAEIVHRDIGLTTSSLHILDEEYGVFVVEFNLTKHHGERRAYEVSRLTAESIRTLDGLRRDVAEFAGATDVASEAPSLFVLVAGVDAEGNAETVSALRNWETRKDYFARSLPEALRPIAGRAHVLRRAYAMLFFYRYEIGSLQALAEHLAHDNAQTTQIYLTTASDGRPSLGLGYQPAAERTDDGRLSMAIESERLEYMRTKIESLLQGRRFKGGFTKLVRRLVRRLLLSEAIDVVKSKGDAADLATELMNRGYLPTPMKHGICFATSKSHLKVSARCYSKDDGGLHQEAATPQLCRNCVHHLTNVSFMRTWTTQLEHIRMQMRVAGLTGRSATDAIAMEQMLSRYIEEIARDTDRSEYDE